MESSSSRGPLDWRAGEAHSNGLTLAYEECGNPEGEPIILLTGLSWQLIHWPESYCAGLAEQGLRVIRLDHRDAGLSSSIKGKMRINFVNSSMMRKFGVTPPADYTIKDMSDDLIGFIDALNLEKVHLVGFSLGGVVAQLTAARVADKISSLTLLMTTTNDPWLPAADADVLQHLMTSPPDKTDQAIIERTLELHLKLASPGYPTPAHELRDLVERAHQRAYKPGGIMRQMHAMVVSGSIESQLRKVTAATQVVHGDSDRMVPLVCGKRVAERIRGAELEIIEGLGHDFPEALMPDFVKLTLAAVNRS